MCTPMDMCMYVRNVTDLLRESDLFLRKENMTRFCGVNTPFLKGIYPISEGNSTHLWTECDWLYTSGHVYVCCDAGGALDARQVECNTQVTSPYLSLCVMRYTWLDSSRRKSSVTHQSRRLFFTLDLRQVECNTQVKCNTSVRVQTKRVESSQM